MLVQRLTRAAAVAATMVALTIGAAPGASAADDNISIIMLGGPLWDPFFGAMKQGGDDAARDLGVDYQWVTGTDPNNFLADYAKLVKQSASRKPSALVIGNYFPDTLDPMIKEITDSGIPVIIQHDGGASWQDVGAVSYVGFSARDLGRAVGEREVAAGAKYGLCVNHVPGNTTLDLDCLGYNDAFKAAGGDFGGPDHPVLRRQQPDLRHQRHKGRPPVQSEDRRDLDDRRPAGGRLGRGGQAGRPADRQWLARPVARLARGAEGR